MQCIRIILLVFCFKLAYSQDTTQKIIPNRQNSIAQQQKPYVILISADAFRWDLADKYQAENLIKLRESGVQAAYLKPSFPSLTFPNHYGIITGLYPAHHGIVDNTFYDKVRDTIYKKSDKKMAIDSSWYFGKPLWVLAEEQQMLSATFYWPGSEIALNGIRPTYYYNYNETIAVNYRIQTVKNWLQLPPEKRPHFIAIYFHQVDKAAHNFTINSAQTAAAAQIVDDAVAKLVAAAKETGLPINFVFLSDHGMTTVNNKEILPTPTAIDVTKFKVVGGNALLHLYANQKADIKPTYKSIKAQAKNFDVYLTQKTPKAWHYSKKKDTYNRIGDILLVPHLPNIFNLSAYKPDVGQHGFDPKITDMHATFYAWGPSFKKGLAIPAFNNVHVYPLIAKILGLTYSHKIDGKEKVLAPILNE